MSPGVLPVLLGPDPDGAWGDWLRGRCDDVVPEDVAADLALAATLTGEVPHPGSGATLRRWELLATLGAFDLTAARVVEAHLDAVATIAEASAPPPPPGSTWGVFAAEGPGVRLDATDRGGWTLRGVKPWCSLAGVLSHALVTAHTSGGRRLFAVGLRHPGVRPDVGAWRARGLVAVPSGPVEFTDVPAEPVGDVGWYLERPGFAHGGVGVAACWYGGAVGLARTLAAATARRPPDDVALMHLGAVDVRLHAARAVLAESAVLVDAGAAPGARGAVLAQRVRGVVAGAVEDVLRAVGHALGPAPLALDDEHARRVGDLTLYVRQHHAERDHVALGRDLAAGEPPW